MGRPPITTEHVTIGPPVPRVPFKDFSKMSVPAQQMKDMWAIVGPSVKLNMNQDIPLWKVITMAYIEGLIHGAGVAKEVLERDKMSDVRKTDPGRRGRLWSSLE